MLTQPGPDQAPPEGFVFERVISAPDSPPQDIPPAPAKNSIDGLPVNLILEPSIAKYAPIP